MRWQAKLKRTTIILIVLTAFLTGIALARTKLNLSILLEIIPLAVVFAVARKSKSSLMLLLILIGVALGLWRGQAYMHKLAKYEPLYKRQVTITGQADTDAIYGKGTQLTFDITNPHVTSPYKVDLPGKISVKGFGIPSVYRGDTVKISGKLYPTRGSRQASISYSQITLVNHANSTIENLRKRFVSGMYNALPEPLASFGLGLLIGQRNTLPDDVNNQLSAVGLTHIVAVSGYNLTIIMLAVAYLLKNRSKYQATLLSAALIVLFILFTGFSASIVRAAIVSGLTIAAGYYGRSFRPMMLILLAAAMTAGWYPLYLWSDIGWYLSFLAFFGVLIIAPLALKRIYKNKKPKLIALVTAETLSAQLMALPFIMYIFGEVSIVALPANVLVVPLVPLAMLLSFIAALAGMLFAPMAGWLAWPARILLTYMLDVISLMSRIPHALVANSLSLAKIIVVYAVIIFVCLVIWSKTKTKNGTITDILIEE